MFDFIRRKKELKAEAVRIAAAAEQAQLEELERSRLKEAASMQDARAKYDGLIDTYKLIQSGYFYESIHQTQAINRRIDLAISTLKAMQSNVHLTELLRQDIHTSNSFADPYHFTFGALRRDGNNVILDDVLRFLENEKNANDKRKQKTQDFEKEFNAVPDFPLSESLRASPVDLASITPAFKCSTLSTKTPISRANSFVAIDTETTGLSPQTAEIIQLSAIKYINMQPISKFCTFVKPSKGIDPSAKEINKISEEDVKDAPPIDIAIANFDSFISDAKVLVGHNITFDCNFLFYGGSKAMHDIACGINKVFLYDTLSMSRSYYSYLKKFSLESLSQKVLHIVPSNMHNAAVDAALSASLFSLIFKNKTGA